MKNLAQRLTSTVAAVGLATCVHPLPPELEHACTTQTPAKHTDFVEVPANVNYENVTWDRAYFQAIDKFENEGNLYLFDLMFESDCGAQKGIKARRVLTRDEVESLEIRTRTDLAAYLKGKSKEIGGYLGPNILF